MRFMSLPVGISSSPTEGITQLPAQRSLADAVHGAVQARAAEFVAPADLVLVLTALARLKRPDAPLFRAFSRRAQDQAAAFSLPELGSVPGEKGERGSGLVWREHPWEPGRNRVPKATEFL